MNKKQIKKEPLSVKNPVDPTVLKKLKVSLGIIVAIFAFLLYAQSISFSYTLDDATVITYNSLVKQGFAGIPTLLKTDRLFGMNNEALRTPEYRPVSLVMFAIEWQLFPNNPHVGHLVNVLLYAITCLVLFFLLCKLFERRSYIYNIIVPFVCTLLYAAHPIHTEVVDNIKSRDEIVCFLFAILAAYLVFVAMDKKSPLFHVLASVSFLISLLTKETSITFLILIPLMLYVFTNAEISKIVKDTVPLIVVTCLYLFIRYEVLSSIHVRNFYATAINNSLAGAPDWISQKATAFYVLLKYVILLIFPHPLSYDYSIGQIPIKKMQDPAAFIGLLIYLAMGLYAVMRIKNKDVMAYAILFYLFTLAPVSNIFFLIGSQMGERFLYEPSLGFCIVVSFLLIKFTKTESIKSRFSNLKQFISSYSNLFIIVFIIAGLYSVKTIARSRNWKNEIELFSHDVNVVPNSAKAHLNWAVTILTDLFAKEQNPDKQTAYNEEIIKELNKAVSLIKNYDDAYDFLAQAYNRKKDYKNAIDNYEMISYDYLSSHTGIYKEIGLLYYNTGNDDKAIMNFDSALKYNPNMPEVYNNLGSIYAKRGMLDKARSEFEKAIELNPKFANAYFNEGVMLYNYGKYDEAIIKSQKAVELDSGSIGAYINLGKIYGTQKDFTKALEYFNKAYKLDSLNKQTLSCLATTYQMKGDLTNAKLYMDKSNRIKSE